MEISSAIPITIIMAFLAFHSENRPSRLRQSFMFLTVLEISSSGIGLVKKFGRVPNLVVSITISYLSKPPTSSSPTAIVDSSTVSILRYASVGLVQITCPSHLLSLPTESVVANARAIIFDLWNNYKLVDCNGNIAIFRGSSGNVLDLISRYLHKKPDFGTDSSTLFKFGRDSNAHYGDIPRVIPNMKSSLGYNLPR